MDIQIERGLEPNGQSLCSRSVAVTLEKLPSLRETNLK